MKQKKHTIQNAIICQIGDFTFVVQGKRFTERKKQELFLLSRKVLQKLGLIQCEIKDCIKYVQDWAIKGDLELFTDKAAKLNDIEIANTDNIYYSSRITIRNHPVMDFAC